MQVSKKLCVCRQNERCSIGIYPTDADYGISTHISILSFDVIFYALFLRVFCETSFLMSVNRVNYFDYETVDGQFLRAEI